LDVTGSKKSEEATIEEITIDEEEITEISKIDNTPQNDKKIFKEVVIEEIILDEDYASENQEKQIEPIASTQLVLKEQENDKRTHEIVNKVSEEIDKLKSGEKAEVKEVPSEQTFDKKGHAEKECILRGNEDSSGNRVEEVTIEEVTLDEDLVNEAETVIDKTRRNILNDLSENIAGHSLESESIVQDGISSKKIESPSKGDVKLNKDQDVLIEEEPENEMDALKKYLESLPASKPILSNNVDNSDFKSNSERIPFSERDTMESSSMMEDMDLENLGGQSGKLVSEAREVTNKETIGTENLIIMAKEDASKHEFKSSVPSAKDIKDHSATISKGDCENPIETQDNSDNLVSDAFIESKKSDADEDMTDGTVKPKNSIILLHTFGLQAKREADDPEMKNAPVRKVARKSTSKLPANPVKIITNEISSDIDFVEKEVVSASTSSNPKNLMNPEVLVVDTFETVVDTCESVEVCETIVDNCETNTECNLEIITTNTSESSPSHNDSRNTSFLLLSPEKTMVGSGCSLEEQMVII